MNSSGVGRFIVTGQLCSTEVLNQSLITWWSSLSRQQCRCKATQKVIRSSFHKAAASPSFQSELSGWRIYKPGRVPTRGKGTMHPQVELSQGTTISTKSETLLCNDGQELVITGLKGKDMRFHAVWLRYNCQCPDCVQPHSGQRLLETANVNPDTVIETANFNENGTELHIKWADSQHHGHVKVDFLQQNNYHGNKEPESQDQGTRLPSMSYEEVMSGDKGLLRWLQHINRDGMCLVKGAPTGMTTLTEVVEKIAPIQQTIYGKLFGVESTPNPINVAYTSVKLDYHMDLVYYESPPGLQFLHCIRFDDCVIGGENLMLNVIGVAERFRKQHPADFDVLTKVPATFQKVHFARADPVMMKYQRPHINLSHKGEIVNVIWSPQFEGPLCVDYDDVQKYYRAYHKFSKAIHTDQDCVELRLVPGDILSFNNRTILHARKSFELNGGVRKLQGCYVNIDEYKSKLAVLTHLQGDTQPVKHVGNQCWL